MTIIKEFKNSTFAMLLRAKMADVSSGVKSKLVLKKKGQQLEAIFKVGF